MDQQTQLLDTRSTHNFILADMMKEIDQPTHEYPQFCVVVGNDNKLTYGPICRNVKLQLRKADFKADLNMLPIKGADTQQRLTVLGMAGKCF